jgi:C2H2-type zinc finger
MDDALNSGIAPSEEAAAAKKAAADSAAAHSDIPDDRIAIFDPEHESLVYGAQSDIRFGPRGGFEPHIWIGERDHPLLGDMLTAYPAMFEVGAPNKVYVCDVCGQEFRSVPSLRGHKSAKHGGAVVKS